MNLSQFQADLADAIQAAIVRSHDIFAGDQLTCLALDIHPCHGFLNLCMRTTTDEKDVPWVADWKHSSFAACYGVANWPEAMPIAEALESAYLSLSDHCPNGEDSTLSWPFFVYAARSLLDVRIKTLLEGFNLCDSFRFFIGDPDDHESGINYCELAVALDLAGIN